VFWSFITVFLLLTWLGACPAERPYTEVALALTLLYFLLVVVIVLWAHAQRALYFNNSTKSN
jgi:quinol-cytochrome oxidoreductase complex cytochrome b subunit